MNLSKAKALFASSRPRANAGRCIIAGLMALCVSAATSLAQTYRTVGSSYEIGSWVYKPIYRSDLADHRVDHIIAMAKPGTAKGQNITAIWYQRPANDDQPWTAKAWEAGTVAEVIKTVKSSLDIPDVDDATWPNVSKTGIQAASVLQQGKKYQKGFLADDPWGAVVAESSARDEIVSALKDWGMKVADPSFEKSEDDYICLKEMVLLGIAKSASKLTGLTSETIDDTNTTAMVQLAFDTYKDVVTGSCTITIPIPWDLPDVAPRIIFPLKWIEMGPPENWKCRQLTSDMWAGCWEVYRHIPGTICTTIARIRNGNYETKICCYDCDRFIYKVCCGPTSCEDAIRNCGQPIRFEDRPSCIGDLTSLSPCKFDD